MATEVRDTYIDPKTVIMTPAAGGAPLPTEASKKEGGFGLSRFVKITATFLTWGFFGYVGWMSCCLFNRPSYSEIAVTLAREGMEQEGQALSEIGRVCQDEAKTPRSCKSLFDSLKQIKELAQK